MAATLLIAAHGTRSPEGTATTAALAKAVAAARPDVAVSLCFLDVAEPSLATALDGLRGQHVVVVPLLLSAGYHVTSDIPAVVSGRDNVQVARHLGPDPAVIGAVADRLAEAAGTGPVMMAAIASSRSSARAEVDQAAVALGTRIGRPVRVLELGADVPADVGAPFAVATYLLAEGGFLDDLRARVVGRGVARGVVADPIGVHSALVELVWARYDEVS